MKKRVFILVFAAAALASCVEPYGNFDYAAFNRERQLWLEQGIQNYSFFVVKDTWAATMYVQDGVLAYIQLDGEGVPVPAEGSPLPHRFSFCNTISDLYAGIEQAASLNNRGDRYEILYDSEWHYPRYFYYSPRKSNFVLIKISEFSVGAEMP